MTRVGAAVTLRPGQSWAQAITEFETATGRTMPVRRCYDGAPVTDVGASSARYDLKVRKSLLSIKPTMSTPLSTLTALAESIVTAEHECDVIVYHEPVDNMTGPEFVDLYQRTAAPLRSVGVPVGVCFTNWSCNLPYSNSQSALEHYWPGDGLVDFLAIDEYPVGEITSTKDATPMDQRARRVTQFAAAHGVDLTLAEYGVDGGVDQAKAERWLRSVTDWADDLAARGRPLRDMCYFSSDVGGNYWLTNHDEFVDAYTDGYSIL